MAAPAGSRQTSPIGQSTAYPPSLTDGFVATVSQRIGGPIGRHAARRPLVESASGRAAHRHPGLPGGCGVPAAVPPQPADAYTHLCYSDIPLLYPIRGLMQGNTPYLDSGNYPVLEYPVLTGYFLELERILTRLLGGAQGINLTPAAAGRSTFIWFSTSIPCCSAGCS